MPHTSRVAALESTAIDLVQAALKPATVKAYNTTLAQFQNFLSSLDSRYKGLPANPGQVILFVADLFNQGLSASTIVSKMSAISYYHKLDNKPDPMSHFLVQKALSGVKRLATSSDVRLPITLSMLHRLVQCARHVVSIDYYIKLLQAMMVLSFFAFLRPGEVTTSSNNLKFENVQICDQQIRVTFMSFKHHHGKPVTLLIPAQTDAPCPVQALRAYLDVRGTSSGPLFCHPGAKPISYQCYSKWFQSLLKVMAIRDVYGLHSFRIGAATLAASRNISSVLIQQMGRWHSNAYSRYIRIPVVKF